MRKMSCAENYDYIKNRKSLLRTKTARPIENSGLRLRRRQRRRKKRDFGLALDVPGVMHFRTGTRAHDLDVHVLRGSLRRTDQDAGRERDRFEAAPGTSPCAGGVQSLARVVIRRSVTISIDFELSDDHRARCAGAFRLARSSGLR